MPEHGGSAVNRLLIDGGDGRWDLIWRHREDLLRIARRRTVNAADAEDVVAEAMLRAAHRPQLDPHRLGGWLATVTIRLCVDRQRRLRREAFADSALLEVAEPEAAVEHRVCDRAEAEWLAGHIGQLPERQARALWLRSAGLGIDQIAARMAMSASAIESLLARARRTMRAVLASAAAALAWVCGGFRRVSHQSSIAGGAVLGGIVIAALVLITPGGGDPDHPEPDVPVRAVPQGVPSPPDQPSASERSAPSAPAAGPETGGPEGPVMGEQLERTRPEPGLEPERTLSDPPDTGITDRPNAWLQLVPVPTPARIADNPAELPAPALPR